ncbi:L-2-hydroxyglutarate oxidase [Geopsychrobacter electrodiphilus]|uniref:L-2-hydroxyglutarate oxidase n=1 Tax=Geopsychrobacter electrodiphilus TaxID=225196 RepID=UPI000379AD00|nr:L-2-hydroxyglutarate oxidase [Geopsychrobacter electrodiphilus]
MKTETTLYDYLLIGGGIVGASTALQLQQRFPAARILLLEKESTAASHQTGHNSGVIHAGVYYAPGSLKAQFCREGSRATMAFCEAHKIPYQCCGKLLVATNAAELGRMEDLAERCRQNEIEIEILSATQLKAAEPNIAGLGALLVPATGIVDYRQITMAMLEEFARLGGEIRLSARVAALYEEEDFIEVVYGSERIRGRFLVCCAGLMADRVLAMLGIDADFRIVPFRGEYYQLPTDYNDIVSHLIYPIPDPELPFLGVHLTRMIDGSVTVGPNAVVGWKREGYGRVNFSLRDSIDNLSFPGFWRVMRNHLRSGTVEMKNSLWKRGYLQLVRKYCPQLALSDLRPYPAGIRAQAVMADGSLVHDFLFAESPRSLHVCNAPSPAATSALPIGAYICDQIEERRG